MCAPRARRNGRLVQGRINANAGPRLETLRLGRRSMQWVAAPASYAHSANTFRPCKFLPLGCRPKRAAARAGQKSTVLNAAASFATEACSGALTDDPEFHSPTCSGSGQRGLGAPRGGSLRDASKGSWGRALTDASWIFMLDSNSANWHRALTARRRVSARCSPRQTAAAAAAKTPSP